MVEITTVLKDEVSKDAFDFHYSEWSKQDLIYMGRELMDKYGADETELRFFVARDDGKVVGVLYTYISYGVGWLISVIVSPKMRGKGIGTELIKEFEDYAKKQGLVYLWLETRREFKNNVKLYESLGYEVESELPVYYFGLPWIRMGKKL